MPEKMGKPWRLRGMVGHGGPGSSGARSQHFFDWLTDPVKNGAGALIDLDATTPYGACGTWVSRKRSTRT